MLRKEEFSHSFKIQTRLLNDMGQALDDFSELTIKYNSKVLKICYGPGMNQLITMHPDLSRIIFKSGIEPN